MAGERAETASETADDMNREGDGRLERFYQEYGNPDGEILLFIHGGGVDGWMWEQQLASFQDCCVLVPTLQGHGVRSNEHAFSIRQNAEELLILLEQKNNGRSIHVAGFSIGAQIALEMISLSPGLFRSAMINSALLKPMKSAVPLIEPAVKLTYPLIQNRRFARLQAKTLYVDGDFFESYYETSRQMGRRTLTDMLEENLCFSLPAGIGESSTRILATAGEKEQRAVRKSAELLGSLPNGDAILISDVGHGLPIAQPGLFNWLLRQWLKKQLSEIR